MLYGKRQKRKKQPKPSVKPVSGIEVNLLECGRPTESGRIYPPEVMANAIAGFNAKEHSWVTVSSKDEARVRLKDVVGKAKLSIFEDLVTAHIVTLDTEEGRAIGELMEDGKVRFVPRGVGTVVDDVVQDDYRIVAIAVAKKEGDDGR